MITLAVAYMRISTDIERQANSFDAQRAAIQAYANNHAITITSWHQDEVSGSTSPVDRPGLLTAIASLRETQSTVLLVAKWDRFGRAGALDTAIAENEITKANASLVSADGMGNGTDPANILQKELLQAFARFERAMISARTRAAMAVMRSQGRYTGGLPPWGYRLQDGSLAPNEAEQCITAKVKQLILEGAKPYQITKSLKASGIKSRKNTPLTQVQVQRIIMSLNELHSH